MFREPARTQADVNFSLLGFPIRISGWFWLGVLVIGWPMTQPEPGAPSNAQLRNVVLWLTAVFLSILIHELGHSLAMRRFGISSHIVLYHFGGLAVPDSASGYARHPNQRIFISLAGPLLQIASAFLMMFAIAGSGRVIPLWGFVADLLMLPKTGNVIENYPLFHFCHDYLYISVYWALINLLPVYPLDGGQIARELFLLKDRTNPIKNSLILSIATGAIMALWALQNKRTFIALLFGSLAYSSYQALQGYNSGRFGGRPRW